MQVYLATMRLRFCSSFTFPQYSPWTDTYCSLIGIFPVHQGNICKIIKKDSGGHLITYDVDTTPGTSGSVVNLLDNEFVQKCRNEIYCPQGLSSSLKMAIGIHTGYDSKTNCNFGTLISQPVNEWIEQTLTKHSSQIQR